MVWVHKWNRWNLQLFIIVNIIENKRLKARTDHHVLLLRDAGVHGHKRLKTRSCDHITSCAFDSALRCWCACVYNLYPLQRTWCITVWSECAVKSVCFGSSLVSLQFLTHLWNQSSWGDKEAIALEGWWLISAFQTALIMCIYIYMYIMCIPTEGAGSPVQLRISGRGAGSEGWPQSAVQRHHQLVRAA